MLPTLFLSHGAPNVALYDLPARRFFDGLAATLPRPRALLVASAHYATAQPAVTVATAPRTIHDFHGFEDTLYDMRYPAPGDPALAARVLELLRAELRVEGIADESWGFDHGAWSPLMRIYPEADIPLVLLSLDPRGDARYHFRLGRALSALRAEGVLVIGSGSMTHNLGRVRPPMDHDAAAPWVRAFLAWMDDTLAAGDGEALCDYQRAAPHARDCHPSEEHLVPLMVALGAAGEGGRGTRLHHSITYGTLAMDAWRFD
ncbi:MAG: class III extradiol ring-cleavage dioxygenase [Gammaproteobacteria bacterium]